MKIYHIALKSPRFDIDTYEDIDPMISEPEEDLRPSGLQWLTEGLGSQEQRLGKEKEYASGNRNIAEYRGEYGSIRYIWMEDGTPVGGIQVVKKENDSVIANIYVDPSYRRSGIATKLIEHAKVKNKGLTVAPFFSNEGASLMGFDS